MRDEPALGSVARRARARSWPRIAIAAVVAAAAGLVATVLVLGFLLSAPAPARIGAPPPDLPAEAVTIASGSGASLRGWLVIGRSGGGAVILMHGVRANRLSMVRRAEHLRNAGFSVLLFDFQAHGESSGPRITFGHMEGFDAHAAVAFARERFPRERIGAIGSSLGGAAALLGPGALPIDALVLEQVYPDIGSAIANRVRVVLGSMLGDVAGPPAAWLFQTILPPFLGVRPADLRPLDRIGEVTAPLLVAAGRRDDRTTLAESRAMFERARAPKVFWVVDSAGHVDLEAYAPNEYHKHVVAFLLEHLQAPAIR